MILIVEDTHEHQRNARGASCYFLELVFYHAETLAEAYYYLGEYDKSEYFGKSPRRPFRKLKIDGVIIDVHFKRHCSDSTGPEAYGIEVALYCSRNNIPCVIYTDDDRHKSCWIKRFGEMLGIPVLVDKGSAGVEGWRQAFGLLKFRIANKKKGWKWAISFLKEGIAQQ